MNDKWMKSFITVAKAGSLTAASNKLYISTQALVQQINLMEEDLGFKLFHRSHSGVSLTSAGEAFLNGVEKISSIYDGTISQCRKLDKLENSIRIPMMNSIVYPRFMETVCSSYRQKFSDRTPPVLVSDNSYNQRPSDILSGKYDIAEWYIQENTPLDGLYFEPLAKIENVCLMSESHTLSNKENINLSDLNHCRIIVPESSGFLILAQISHLRNANVSLDLTRVGDFRYEITDEMDKQGIYLTDSTVATEFSGYTSIPLSIESNVIRGLICKEETKNDYADFFAIAKEVWNRLYDSNAS